MGHRYFILNKPYNMVSQFIGPEKAVLLGELSYDFPEGIHAVGRLDNLSEGLLILTTNKKVTKLLFQGSIAHKRTYLVRVSGIVGPDALERLRTGVPITIQDGANYITPPCEADIVANPANLQPHQLELRQQVPHTWLQISLWEGKYHQVRKMVYAVRHHCRRLIRTAIEDISLGDQLPGTIREMEETEFFEKLHISDWK